MRRSEPKASAKNPRSNSGTEKRVYSGGAPAKAPGGGARLLEAAKAVVADRSDDMITSAVARLTPLTPAGIRCLARIVGRVARWVLGNSGHIQASGPGLVIACASHGAPDSHQALLRYRGDQGAVTLEYKSAAEAARAVQVGRILRVEQPVVGAERPV